MSKLQEHHKNLNEEGIGKCSVPMWMDGMPAGFCDKDAYGNRPPSETWRDAYTGAVHRFDGRYSGYVPGLACPCHGGPKERAAIADQARD